MADATFPATEAQRLAALHALAILDTPAEERFDRLTRLASAALGLPIALVTLVDETRTWVKAATGFPRGVGPRGESFCTHVVADGARVEVPDAREDARFKDSAFVTGDPGVRCYVGQPLRSACGHVLGALCVVGFEPRVLSDAQRAVLEDLAAIASEELRTLQVAHALREAAAGEVKGAVLAGLNHELRTPLNAIIGYSELLAEDAVQRGAGDLAADLARIRAAGAQLQETLGALIAQAAGELGEERTPKTA